MQILLIILTYFIFWPGTLLVVYQIRNNLIKGEKKWQLKRLEKIMKTI